MLIDISVSSRLWPKSTFSTDYGLRLEIDKRLIVEFLF